MKRRSFTKSDIFPALAAFIISDLFFSFLLWLCGGESFRSFILIILIFSAILIVLLFMLYKSRRRRLRESALAFIKDPTEENRSLLISSAPNGMCDTLGLLLSELERISESAKGNELSAYNYMDFIESWAHEIKTPLSVASLVLENHSGEMPEYVEKRLSGSVRSINEYTELILYYARIRAEHPDFIYEKFSLCECVSSALESFEGIRAEKNISLSLELSEAAVFSDKRALSFIISQLLSNAFKYTDKLSPKILIKTEAKESGASLYIYNNGQSVSKEDAPFIFDKGFTGVKYGISDSTGIGMYLVKKYSDTLSLKIRVSSAPNEGNGFAAEISFPQV